MSFSGLAPVLIVTYDRLEHLRKTVVSLRGNAQAEKTDLFIASDFQRSESEASKVTAVRDYLEQIDGFRSLTVFAREKNYGVVENCNLALQTILKKFDRFIVMNDDLVTAPGFLTFINDAFDRFGANERVFSITGYCPPIEIPSSYQHDGFFLPRMSAWGCGITKDRYESVREISRKDFDDFAANKRLSRAFIKGGGKDLMVMLKKVAYGSLDAWDLRCMYTQFMENQHTIYPTQSLVQNIGFDGTGMHCGITNKFDVNLSDKTVFQFPDEVFVDPRIVRANLIFRDGTKLKNFHARVKSKVRRVLKRLIEIEET